MFQCQASSTTLRPVHSSMLKCCHSYALGVCGTGVVRRHSSCSLTCTCPKLYLGEASKNCVIGLHGCLVFPPTCFWLISSHIEDKMELIEERQAEAVCKYVHMYDSSPQIIDCQMSLNSWQETSQNIVGTICVCQWTRFREGKHNYS